jgi:hypothetical protein
VVKYDKAYTKEAPFGQTEKSLSMEVLMNLFDLNEEIVLLTIMVDRQWWHQGYHQRIGRIP